MLAKVKTALRITTAAFDSELTLLINAAVKDLNLAGADAETVSADTQDELVQIAIITYCKWRFGDSQDAERLGKLYEMQKAQLQTATAYRQ